MRSMALWPFDEEFRVELDSALGLGVKLYHPALDSIGIELGIDRAVERVGEIDAPTIAADLHHLRAAVEPAVLGLRVGCLRDDATDTDLARQLRLEGIGNIVLMQIARAPAGHIKKAVVHGEIDVGNERRHGFET